MRTYEQRAVTLYSVVAGPAPAAVFMNLVPVTALVIEVLLGGSIETRQLFGGALVIAGVWMTNRR